MVLVFKVGVNYYSLLLFKLIVFIYLRFFIIIR